jgi:hypothetical protein
MKVAPLHRATYAAVPGRHEALALTDYCDEPCWTATRPAAVIDEADGHGRVAVYRCCKCGLDWLCWWAAP